MTRSIIASSMIQNSSLTNENKVYFITMDFYFLSL
jgi:hypothetical protein